MGFDVAAPAKGYPLQVLTNPEETWKAFSIGTIKSEKDVPEPQREVSLKLPNPDYQFRGYRLDAKKFPTFSYRFRSVEVTDRFQPEPDGNAGEGLLRTLTFKGEPEANTVQRIAIVQGAPDANGYYPAGPIALRIDGAMPQLRAGEGGQELLVPIAALQELKVHYRWVASIGGKKAAGQ
jgi:hypothetical protein